MNVTCSEVFGFYLECTGQELSYNLDKSSLTILYKNLHQVKSKIILTLWGSKLFMHAAVSPRTDGEDGFDRNLED